jgi:hypothetical protein
VVPSNPSLINPEFTVRQHLHYDDLIRRSRPVVVAGWGTIVSRPFC